MWSTSEEPPGTMEEGPPESTMQVADRCEQNKSQLESFKEIMLRNQQSLRKKEEEVQEYGRRLSKIKSRTKLSRRSKESAASPKESMPKDESPVPETFDPAVDDISQARTPKAKSSLLQKKLAENRKAFEQRSKEITESKRAVEEKVEAIRQQLDEKDAGTVGYKEQLPITPIRSLPTTSDILSPQQNVMVHEKEMKIVELSNKILELEASLFDLQENLKEKDSVIESKTKAVTLMSADLSKKGKTTLDALEETKDEMRTMQEHFVLLETSLKDKNDNLLQQLKERDDKITTLEETVTQYEQQINEQEKSASATVDFSRSTMDTLVETKDAMKSMQENFVLIETSLKAKNDNLLQQLEAYEIKLAEANERIFKLESGLGIVKDPSIDDLQFKVDTLELRNKQLQDEKYELQKSVAEMQDTIVNRSVHSDGALIEKDNRIAELENLVAELKQSNKFLEEESKAELQKQLADITLKNEQYFDKINDLEKTVNDLETERGNLIARLPDENAAAKEDEKVVQLTKELEELNKSMIKIKAQHRSKVKNLQKQLKNFKKVSDTNAELVRLVNQVALLEEEKGNLQLSLVDFDELKASTGDLQEYVADLESKVSAQTKEIQTHIEAIAILENQKLDLTQDLHVTKQEISALEAENAESENLRVTAEMKVVDLEEQLDSVHKAQKDSSNISFPVYQPDELLKKIADLTHENHDLYNKLSKLEEKVASDSGSTESFEAIQELDKTDLLKKVEDLTQRNSELTEKLSKLEEKSNSHGGSTDSFETISDGDRTTLLRKIDQLTQENTDLMMKLSRSEEKGSSDTGSTESFERIPEHSESTNKIEFLTQENHELLERLTKLEEQLQHSQISQDNNTSFESVEKTQLDSLLQEKNIQSQEIQMLKEKIDGLSDENVVLETRVEALLAEKTKLISLQAGHEDSGILEESIALVRKRSTSDVDDSEQLDILLREKSILEKEVKESRNTIEQMSRTSSNEVDADSLRMQIQTLMEDNVRVLKKVGELEDLNKKLNDELSDVTRDKDELFGKINSMTFDDERRELVDKLERLNLEKENVARERQDLQEQINAYLHKPNEESSEVFVMDDASQNMEAAVVASLEREIEDSKNLIAEQADLIEEMKLKLSNKEIELDKTRKTIEELKYSGRKAEALEQELKEMSSTVEEWKYKCYDMESKMSILEAGKVSIEEGFRILQREHDNLLEEATQKETSSSLMKEELQSTIHSLEKRLEDMMTEVSAKEQEVASLKEQVESTNDELSYKYAQLEDEMSAVHNLQNEMTYYTTLLQEKQNAISSLTSELEELKEMLRNKDDEIYSLRREVSGFHERLQNSKSIEEYNSLAEAYERKEEMLHEIECQFDEYKKEGSEVSVKLQRLCEEKDDLGTQLTKKENEYVDLMKEKENLKDEIAEVQAEKSNAESRIYELQSILDNNAKFVDDLQTELRAVYRQIEQLKLKHTEDMEMQNQRLEVVIEELNNQTQENEFMRINLEEKERLVGQNVTEENKIALEAQVTSLEARLAASEDKIQAQIEKMKKIAANLKKKTNLCQELEARISELEEKLTSEKDEKEAKNRQIQDVEIIIREKDNRITDLRDKLALAVTDASEATTNLQKVTEELTNAKEKILLLTQQIAEMGEEVTKLRTEIVAKTEEYTAEKDAKEAVQKAFETYRQDILEEAQQKELKLEEVTETARELRVRMDVMEQEYVEQLGLISNLKTENGLLLSKQAQINEKLENVEKESDERRIFIEQLQAKVVHTVEVSTQASQDHVSEGAPEVSGMRHCNNYEECQALISDLEAKVQERDADLKKLSNELANEINNVLDMRNISDTDDTSYEPNARNGTLIDKVEELVNQYKTLEQSNEDARVKLTDAVTETNQLRADIQNLQSLNITLEEKLKILQEELNTGKASIDIVETIDPTQTEIYDKQLLSLQEMLQVEKMQAEQLHQELHLKIVQLESEKQQLSEREESLRHTQESLEDEVKNLQIDKSGFSQEITDLKAELQRYKRDNQQSVEPSAMSQTAVPLERPLDAQDNAPQLFDASKIFGSTYASQSDILTSNEMVKLQNELRGKEVYCSNLTKEIEHLKTQIAEERLQLTQDCNRYSDELRITQDRLSVVQADLERLEKLVTEKNVQIDSLNAELRNVDLQIMAQCNRQDESDTKLEELVSLKDNQINELKAELSSTTEILEVLSSERDQQVRQSESNRVQIANLEAELRNSNDTELIQELQDKISDTLKERDLLQLQVNDLTRSMGELQNTIETGRNLQMQLDVALRETAEAKEATASFMRALEEARKGSVELNVEQGSAAQVPIIELATANPSTGLEKHTEVRASEGAIDLDMESAFNVDEEMWDWNADVIQLVDQDHVTPLIPSEETKLRVQVTDLEDRIKELVIEKEKITEESKATQIRSGKLVKKLKEYKAQVENLQQQIKIQKSASDFYELDSAIEEELKAQISKLEKTLNDSKEEYKTIVAEKEALLKRLDVITSANERYMELKEKQDLEMEVLRIQNKELINKVNALDLRIQDTNGSTGGQVLQQTEQATGLMEESVSTKPDKQRRKRSTEEHGDLAVLYKKSKDELDDLKDQMEALAIENEQLQHTLENLKDMQVQQQANEKHSSEVIQELTIQCNNLQDALRQSEKKYDDLREQYEQSVLNTNDQLSTMQQNADALRLEAHEQINKLNVEIINLQEQVKESSANADVLQTNLENSMQETSKLEQKVSQLLVTEERLAVANSSLADVTDLLNVRIQEVADLKQELQKQYIEWEDREVMFQNTIQLITSELNEKKQELDRLRRALSDKENELVQHQGVETASAIVSQATQELMQKHAIELEEKDTEIRSLQEKSATLQIAVDEYSLDMQSNIAKLEAQQQEFDLMRQDIIQKDSMLLSIQNDLQSARDAVIQNEMELSKQLTISQELTSEKEQLLQQIDSLVTQLNETRTAVNVEEFNLHMNNLKLQLQNVTSALAEKQLVIEKYEQELKEFAAMQEVRVTEINGLQEEIGILKISMTNKTEEVNNLKSEVDVTREALEAAKRNLEEKSSLLEKANQSLSDKQLEFNNLFSAAQSDPSPSNIVDGLPLFRMGDNESEKLQNVIDALRSELQEKMEEIEHFKYMLNENTYPSILQELQERINLLYTEKAGLESSLEVATQAVAQKERALIDLRQQIEIQSQEFVPKEEASSLTREPRSTKDQEEIVKLQNELHSKEQEINDLKYIISEKDSQLSLQASMEPQSDDYELREMRQRLYIQEQEIEQLKRTIADLQKEVSRLAEFETLSTEYRIAIEKLSAEKEHMRLEGEEFLEKKLKEKEFEIDDIKQKLVVANQKILEQVQLREKDLENLKLQLEESSNMTNQLNGNLHKKEYELMQVNIELGEKERRLAELSITKDAELHNLNVQIHEKEVRIEELLALSEEEQKQLFELRNSLDARETEINTLKKLLEDKVKEYELIQLALKKDVSIMGAPLTHDSASESTSGEIKSQELDVALYMLHQRDVRCEELTHELMQLLEERDTLQLRLSNAIRVNEELRRVGGSEVSLKIDAPSTSDSDDLLVEHPSPSKSEGPVEIAKEAIDAPIGEDKEALALKLSQLHTVSHTKDVRLRDERELRHTQQMSLLAHKDVLSTLPPEAAARLVNANYTLSRDVQSQSSVLLNWLWGKSTPKVVHM